VNETASAMTVPVKARELKLLPSDIVTNRASCATGQGGAVGEPDLR
jgi:hypothetical protein